MAAFSAFVIAGVLVNPSPGVRNLPIAIANLDRGASYHGRHVDFGSQVVNRITVNPDLHGEVAWSLVGNRARIVDAMNDDKDYASLVIPADYSARLATLLSSGASPRAPATLQVLTSPASGLAASSVSTGILLAATGSVGSAVAQQDIATSSHAHVRVTPQAAQVIANP
ncbi:MAG TPA: hypothetical protein VF221_20005, partial [Chloroflexota bacterium]